MHYKKMLKPSKQSKATEIENNELFICSYFRIYSKNLNLYKYPSTSRISVHTSYWIAEQAHLTAASSPHNDIMKSGA